MNARTLILIGMLAAMASSFIPSLFPLYTEEDLVTDDRLKEHGITGISGYGFFSGSMIHQSMIFSAGTGPDLMKRKPINWLSMK